LLSGDLQIESLRLIDVEIELERNLEGRSNWDGILETAARAGDGTGQGFTQADLHDVSIQRLNVMWRPAPDAIAQSYQLERLTLVAGAAGRLDLEVGGTLDGVPLSLVGDVPILADWLTPGADLPVTLKGTVSDTPLSLTASLIRGRAGDLGLGDRVEATEFAATFGPLIVSGTAALDFSAPRPYLSATLSAESLNLDQFKSNAVGPSPMDRTFQIDGLQVLDGEVTVSMASISRGDFRAEEIKASVTLKDKVLRIGELSARIEGGALEGSVEIDASGTDAKMSVDALLLGMDIGSALQKVSGEDLLVGRGDVIAALTATGHTPNQLIASLGGRGGVIMRKGEVLNAYWELVAEDLATRFLPSLGGSRRGALNCAVASFDLKDGKARSRVLLVDSDRVLVGGEGEVNLPSRTLNLRLVPQPKDASLISLATPLLINGPIENPSVAPDPLAVAKDVGTAVIGGMINPLALILPFVDSGSSADPCPGAIAVAEGRKAPSGGASGSKPGAIEGFFDKLRKAVE
jgi:hypothetical protein